MSYILRPYQETAFTAVDQAWVNHNSVMVVMATGLGKTVTFAHMADQFPGRVLVIAHREELIRQSADTIHKITGKPVAVEMGRERAGDELYGTKVTVASIQTLSRIGRRERFHPDHFALVIVDEAHHAAAATYREVLDYFASARKLLVTATPQRGDGLALGLVCDCVAFDYGIEPAIDDGWLVPVKQTVVKVDGLDFSSARTLAGDFNEADLERILTEEQPLHEMCASAVPIIGDSQTLWFCVNVAHSQAVAGVLSRYASGEVAFLSGKTDKSERREKVSAYKKGRIQHMVNCGLFLEGFDAPATSVVVMARPTKSLTLYTQVLGRGTRPLPGVVDGPHLTTPDARKQSIAMSQKPAMVVIDYAGNAGRHKIVTAADVLGGRYDAPTREYAKETLAQEGRTEEIEAALERAQDELALLSEEQDRRRRIKAEVRFRSYEVSPFANEYAGRATATKRPPTEPCSDKQAGYIAYLSHQPGASKQWKKGEAKRLSFKQAKGVIRNLKAETGL